MKWILLIAAVNIQYVFTLNITSFLLLRRAWKFVISLKDILFCFSSDRFYPLPFPTASQSSARALSTKALNEISKEMSERIEAMDQIKQNMDREFKSSRVVGIAEFRAQGTHRAGCVAWSPRQPTQVEHEACRSIITPTQGYPVAFCFCPWSPNSDENEISLYVITTCSNVQVMRIKKVINKDTLSWYLDKFCLLVPSEMYGE